MMPETENERSHWKVKRAWRRPLKVLLWSVLAVVTVIVIVCGLWAYYFIFNGTFLSSAKLVETTTCGNGDYRLLLYMYRTGDGYLELVDRKGLVLDKSTFSEGAEIGGARWSKDCLSVNVGTDSDRVDLKVHP